MKKLLKTGLLIAIISITALNSLNAQVNFMFPASLYGRSVDGLGSCTIQNISGQPLLGNLWVKVKELRSGLPVVQVLCNNIQLPVGQSNLQRQLFGAAAFQFFSNPISSIASQTRQFPPGNYEYCFQFEPANKGTEISENCYDAEILPLVPISLQSPSNLDSICIKRPVLTWTPPLPISPTMRYRLLLVEKRNLSAVEALAINPPILLLDNLSGNMVNFPGSAPELIEGKTYCWQVLAYEQGVVMSTSEIWEFTIQCKEQPPLVQKDNYRELRSLMNGNYYVAERYVRFSFQNNYSVKKLNYEILALNGGVSSIKHLPEIPLKLGLNLVDLDLFDADLQSGMHYLLKVYPFNEEPITIRFLYK